MDKQEILKNQIRLEEQEISALPNPKKEKEKCDTEENRCYREDKEDSNVNSK